MAILTDMIVRGYQSYLNGTRTEARLSQAGNIVVDKGLPDLFDLARARKIFAANTGAGTEIAPDASLPTTTAKWALYNGYSAASRTHLVVLKLTCHSVSGTLGLGMSLIAGLSTAAQASAVSAYASSVQKIVSGSTTTSSAVFGQNVTLAGAPVWITVASRDQVSAVSVGSGLVADVEGLFIIPPTYALGLSVLAPAGTASKFNCGYVWAEIQLDLD